MLFQVRLKRPNLPLCENSGKRRKLICYLWNTDSFIFGVTLTIMQIEILLFCKLKEKKFSLVKAQCFTFLLLHVWISTHVPRQKTTSSLDSSFPKGKTYPLHAGWVVPVISSNMRKFTAVSVVVWNCVCASPWKFKMSIKSLLNSWHFGKEYEKLNGALFQYLSCYFIV